MRAIAPLNIKAISEAAAEAVSKGIETQKSLNYQNPQS
jgi:hypothetical protein